MCTGGFFRAEPLGRTDGIRLGQGKLQKEAVFPNQSPRGRKTGGGDEPCLCWLLALCTAGDLSVRVVSGQEDSDVSSGETVEGPAAEDEVLGPWGPGKPASLQPCSGECGRLGLGPGGSPA